jgi:hypothetical protein
MKPTYAELIICAIVIVVLFVGVGVADWVVNG